MTYLLDTDTCVYWLNGTQPILERIRTLRFDQLALSAISVAELYFGAYHSTRVSENLLRVAQFTARLPIILPHTATVRTFGQLKAELRRQGQPLADFDLLIASTALSEGRTLVTNNTRHYARVPGLQLENWLTP